MECAVSVSPAGKDNTPGITNLLKALTGSVEKLAAGATLGESPAKRRKATGEAVSDSTAKERSEAVKCLQKVTNAPQKGDGGSSQQFFEGPLPMEKRLWEQEPGLHLLLSQEPSEEEPSPKNSSDRRAGQ